MTGQTPRLVVAGLSGDSGRPRFRWACWPHGGTVVSPGRFQKGTRLHRCCLAGLGGGSPGRNLDTFLMSGSVVRQLFARHAPVDRPSLVEGNRGLCDGMDVDGTHSTATLARLIEAPVLLVVPVTKMTRTAAAAVIGLKTMEPDGPHRGRRSEPGARTAPRAVSAAARSNATRVCPSWA